MEPLTGELEWKVRAYVDSGGKVFADLVTTLGANYNAYLNAYGVGGEFFNPRLNQQAAVAAQSPTQVPGRIFWSMHVSAGRAHIVDGKFRWLPGPHMGPFAAYALP
jgi:hypothetical protein